MMVCYRDMTFCGYWRTCGKADGCHRPLVQQVEGRAAELGLPICQFANVPDCHTDPRAARRALTEEE